MTDNASKFGVATSTHFKEGKLPERIPTGKSWSRTNERHRGVRTFDRKHAVLVSDSVRNVIAMVAQLMSEQLILVAVTHALQAHRRR